MSPLHRHRAAAGLGLAIAALTGTAAQAQSSVSLSGLLDLGMYSKSGQTTHLGTIGRSNIAFAGTEDLGGGYAATFRLSTRFDVDTGTLENSDAQRPFWKDESTVGLKGPFGAVRLGRALSSVWQEAWAYDAWDNFNRIASPQWYAFAPDFLTNPQTREYSRLNNGVFYDSPKLGGFSVHVSAAVEKDQTDLTRGMSSTLKFEDGPFAAMIGLERNSQKDRLAFIGARYKFGQLELMGGYSHVKLNPEGLVYSAQWTNWAGASKPTSKRTALTLGARYTMGASTIKVGLARDFQGSTDGFNYIGSTFKAAGTHHSGASTMASLGYSYALSKRTSLFADVAHVRWRHTDDNGRRKAMGYGLGVSHAF